MRRRLKSRGNPTAIRPDGWTAADLVAWRFRVEMLQRVAAALLGCSRVMLSHYEGGKHVIPARIEEAARNIEAQVVMKRAAERSPAG